MPHLQINARGARPVAPGGADIDDLLRSCLATLPDGAPVIVMIHGYKFSPSRPGNDPHRHILSLCPDIDCPRAVSWPRHLGFGKGDPAEGLCIAFGWEARGTIWRAQAEARRAATALAALIGNIHRHHGGPVDILAHSLGARVALGCLGGLPAGGVGRAILMAGAEFQGTARAALETRAGRGAEFINVTSRENRLFDLLFRACLKPHRPGQATIGAGLGRARPNWIDIQIDDPGTRAALRGLGFRVPAPTRRICHWSGYLRPGLWGFYRAALRRPVLLPLAGLRDALPATTPTRARPGRHPALRFFLPFSGRAPM